MLHQIQLLRHLNVLCNNPFGDLCSNNNKPFGDLRSCHFSFLRVTFSKRYFNVRLGFGVVAVDISLLQPAYVAYEKVMFSVVSVCRGGSRYVTTTSDAMGYPPRSPHGPIKICSLGTPPHHTNLFKLVHLGPSYPLSPVDPLHRAVDLRLKGLLVFCFVLLSHEWEDRTFRTTPKKNIQTFGLKKVSF